MKVFNDLSNATTIFWVAFVSLIALAIALTPLTGCVFAPSRASDPRQMPLGAYKTFDMRKVSYAPWQLFRMSFGHLLHGSMLVAGYLGSYTDLFEGHSDLQSFSFGVLFVAGILGLINHSQMCYDRIVCGFQYGKWTLMLFCLTGQSLVVAQFVTFLALMDEKCSEQVKAKARYTIVVKCLQFPILLIVILNSMRLAIVYTKGEDFWFQPQQLKAKIKV